jgi:hypothetical protein
MSVEACAEIVDTERPKEPHERIKTIILPVDEKGVWQ